MQNIPPGGDGMGVPGCLYRGQPIWVPGLSFGFPTYSVLKEISLWVLQESLWNGPLTEMRVEERRCHCEWKPFRIYTIPVD